MTDCVLFASLFATFAMFAMQTSGGPTGKDLFNLSDVALETGLLLTSSLTFGFAMIAATRQRTRAVLGWLFVTFALGAGFLWLELNEFAHLVAEGAGPQRSAFWSAFFTLVGTHGLHVTVGLLWLVVLVIQMAGKRQLSERDLRRLACLSLFWHFLDIVWICVFSFVYLGSIV
jgi:cytochrome o ubiquinol oxidase subunit III